MDFETLVARVDGPIGRLTLNRPERLNALGRTVMQELISAARWLDGQPDVRVVVVAGAGRAFSAGADLKASPVDAASAQASWTERREAGQLGLRMCEAIESLRAVSIARIHGYAVGGAVLLAASCDLRVAAEDAVLSIPEVDLGIPLTWGGIPRLVRELGPALTKELVMTCRPFTPTEARAWGFINRVVPPERLDEEVEGLARELAAKPSVPVAITKEHVNAVARAMSSALLSFGESDMLAGASADPESREAARRYAEALARRRSGGSS